MTIKDSELRLGNLFKDGMSGDIFPVLEIRKDAIVFDYINYGRWQARPIPLTEEWLLKCGFEKLDRFYEKQDIILLKLGEISYFYYSSKSDKRSELKYLHQLQNLYFALTQEELTIEL